VKRENLEALVGAVALLVIVAVVSFAFVTAGVRQTGGYTIQAEFDNASGVTAGTEVRLSGVKVGNVVDKQLTADGRLAVLTLDIDQSYKIPADSRVRILPDGLLGGSYVQLEPGGALDDMAPGTFVTFDRTQGAINVVDLIARFVVQAAEGGDSGNR